ncbi:MAG: hypothetical protein CSA49_02510 [Gammaproteobacteria bacterium]|nr:MAG: hypothetical protein CSA49_02510 [Gammaproteobacteria bacterium]
MDGLRNHTADPRHLILELPLHFLLVALEHLVVEHGEEDENDNARAAYQKALDAAGQQKRPLLKMKFDNLAVAE